MSYLDNLKSATNYTMTENGAITHKSTESKLLDMFALGGAYRNRSDEDCIVLFKNAYEEDSLHALKCLFYLRDIRGGQGERRFFRVCLNWLAKEQPEVVVRNLDNIPEYGRWDDMYCLIGTPVEKQMFAMLKKQLVLDINSKTPSLMAKWLKSENASSLDTKKKGAKTRKAFGMNHKQYRKTLSMLREKINIVERLMSAGEWDKIEFDKIPSKAGLIYKNAFARRDILKEKYKTFALDKDTKVNAEVLNPVDIAARIFSRGGYYSYSKFSEVDIAMLQKYWDNLKDYYNGREERGIAVVDTSGSMTGTPMNAAVSMGAYIAERGCGPFANHFITFSDRPELVEFTGVDIVDKFQRCSRADWGGSTNIEAVFDLLLDTALKNNCSQDEIPETVYIFSDMEFNSCVTSNQYRRKNSWGYWITTGMGLGDINTLFEAMSEKWANYGYKMPRLIFWNLDARQNNIPAIGDGFSYVSGFSMNMIEQILSGKDGLALCLEKLDSDRYAAVV